jgi:hypothetical protein
MRRTRTSTKRELTKRASRRAHADQPNVKRN